MLFTIMHGFILKTIIVVVVVVYYKSYIMVVGSGSIGSSGGSNIQIWTAAAAVHNMYTIFSHSCCWLSLRDEDL